MWHYQATITIDKNGHTIMGVHEIYLLDPATGTGSAWTENPITPMGWDYDADTHDSMNKDKMKEGLIKQLEMMLADVKKHGIFDTREQDED